MLFGTQEHTPLIPEERIVLLTKQTSVASSWREKEHSCCVAVDTRQEMGTIDERIRLTKDTSYMLETIRPPLDWRVEKG